MVTIRLKRVLCGCVDVYSVLAIKTDIDQLIDGRASLTAIKIHHDKQRQVHYFPKRLLTTTVLRVNN
jgi:hypothetical protein